MEEHQDIARGYTKRDKVLVETLWQDLAQSLNGAGPPSKDVNGWKKVMCSTFVLNTNLKSDTIIYTYVCTQIWTEWKSESKKKLAHNKAECRATGGGPFNKFQLTQTEEAIVQLCGIKKTVDGVSGKEQAYWMMHNLP